MGAIREILAKVELPPPELGFAPKNDSFNLPFSVELREDVHIHWQDIRIEMTAADFDEFAQAVSRAHRLWVEDGKPETSEYLKFYGAWPGEEGLDHYRDRHIRKDRLGRLRHHYRLSPRTEGGKLYFDSVLQIEIQRYDWFHIHYKNFRWEVGPRHFLSVADAFAAAARRYRRMAPLWAAQDTLRETIKGGRSFLGNTFVGRIKRRLFDRKH